MTSSWRRTAGLAAAPTAKMSVLLSRSMPVSPRRLISLSVICGTPVLVTKRMGASSGKCTNGTALIPAMGSSGVTSVMPHGRSLSLLLILGVSGPSAAVYTCCVTATAF